MAKKTKEPSFLERVMAIAAAEGKSDKCQTQHLAWAVFMAGATELEKETIALEWLTHFARTELPSRGDKSGALHRGLIQHQRWFEVIAPYVPAGSVTALKMNTDRLDLEHVLTGAPTVSEHSAHFRKMWFGTDTEKLEALLQTLGEKDLMDHIHCAGGIAASLFYAAADLPGATTEHHVAACLGAYWSGYLGYDPEPAARDEARAWQYIGLYTKGASQFKLKKNATPEQVSWYEKIKHLPAFCQGASQTSPVEVMCRLFPRMMSYVPKSASGVISQGALLTYNCSPPNDVYSVLTHWLPAYREQIAVGQVSGLRLDEFLAMLPQMSPLQTSAELPPLQDFQM
jgi:hypothetical protein